MKNEAYKESAKPKYVLNASKVDEDSDSEFTRSFFVQQPSFIDSN